jgi:hypothetical protein
MWYVKETSLLKQEVLSMGRNLQLSLVMVTAARKLKNCSGGYKQTEKQK